MYVDFQELLSMPAMQGVSIVAGKGGMWRRVSWAQVIELDEIGEWLNPGTLVLITGVAVSQWTNSLMEVARQAVQCNASGMMLYLGPYIKNIPDDLYSFCEEKEFPLLIAPREIRTIDISYQIAERIFSNRQKTSRRETVFRGLLRGEVSETLTAELQSLGLVGQSYQCMVTFAARIGEPENNIHRVEMIGGYALNKYGIRYVSHIENEMIVFLMAFAGRHGIRQVMVDEIFDSCEQILGSCGFYITAGKATDELSMIGDSVSQALKTGRMVSNFGCGRGVYLYADMGVYRLIDAVGDEAVLEEYVNDSLGGLLRSENWELLRTLACYMENGCVLNTTAAELFIHVNTLKYRLKKAADIIGTDVKTPLAAEVISPAIAVLKYLGRL